MFCVVSPAKKLNFDSELGSLPEQTLPRFLDDSQQLVDQLKALSPVDIAKLMKVSDKIAQLNAERFALWQADMSDDQAARVAVLAFRGDTYQGLDADHFSGAQFRAAQQRLRILSGLYGLLRPLDRIRPYRLEMGTKFANSKGRDLYAFWGDKLTRQLAADMQGQGSEVLVNLASNEYFKAIDPKVLPYPVISPVFQDEKNGNYKIISFYAKRARGMMAAWVIKEGITRAEQLRDFDVAGYRYAPEVSTADKPVFRRAEA